MTMLDIRNIAKNYGTSQALHPVSLVVEKGEFVTILGPSGCGKSTLLRILMGITPPSYGEIMLAGKRIDRLPPEARDIAMVFQSYALFPHMTVLKNLSFGLRMKKVPKPEQARRIEHAMSICNLTGLAERLPRQLSGGQQQRVALARAIVMQASLLLFDEPLSNLDAKLRDTLRSELIDLHRKVGTTSLYVTHDQTEAMAMSDRIVVMNGGRVMESGTPLALYQRPTHSFTANFLGMTNIVTVDAQGQTGQLPWGGEVRLGTPATGQTRILLRPESVIVLPQASGQGEIASASFMGPNVLYTIRIADTVLKVNQAGVSTLLPIGSRVGLSIAGPQHILLDRTDIAEAA